jgi:ferredoxin
MKAPVIDLSECVLCGVCIDVCPSVFKMNDAGYVEVAELEDYPEEDVLSAVKHCPVSCIVVDETR